MSIESKTLSGASFLCCCFQKAFDEENRYLVLSFVLTTIAVVGHILLKNRHPAQIQKATAAITPIVSPKTKKIDQPVFDEGMIQEAINQGGTAELSRKLEKMKNFCSKYSFPHPEDLRIIELGEKRLAALLNLEPVFSEKMIETAFIENGSVGLWETIQQMEKMFRETGGANSNNLRIIHMGYKKLASLPLSASFFKAYLGRKNQPISPSERDFLIQVNPQQSRLDYFRSISGLKGISQLSQLSLLALKVDNEIFDAFYLQGRYRMLVYSVVQYAEEGNIEKIVKDRIERDKYVCTSLLSDQFPNFYRQDENVALIFAFNPNNIAAVYPEDAFSPARKGGNLETDQYYRTQKRLQLFTGVVDKIFERFSNRQHDALTRLRRLRSLKVSDSEYFQRIQAEIAHLENEHSRNFKMTNKIFFKSFGITAAQLYQMKEYYSQTSLTREEERIEFEYLFQRPPANNEDIIKELELYESIIASCQKGSSLLQIHPLQTPNQLLLMTRSQTPHIYNRQEASPYNEINLDLSYSYEEGVPTIEAKGILIAENTYLSNPNRFLNVLRSAKKLNIPIFIQPS